MGDNDEETVIEGSFKRFTTEGVCRQLCLSVSAFVSGVNLVAG